MRSTERVVVVGGGLAGSEAAFQLASRGVPVVLREMRPMRSTPAHAGGSLGELVCSNTLGSLLPSTAPGVFKQELRTLGSLIVAAGEAAYVPAGGALGVDRARFSAEIEAALRRAGVEIERAEVTELPSADGPRTVIATGPLTADALAGSLQACTGSERLWFYDAIAPIVDRDTVDPDAGFWANRYGEDGGGDYFNLPVDRERYEAFIDALLAADRVDAHTFEEERYFQGCQPIEAIAARGRESLRFGPMKPVGLRAPSGRRPWAVVQLRRETRDGSAMNLVGFQTRLRWGDQARVLRMIPGLEHAEFIRLGSVHRNTYVDSPRLLDEGLRLRSRPNISLAGQIVGCEGYTESSAMGLWAALSILAEREGRAIQPPPRTSMFGALLAYLREAEPGRFQPMNVNFGLLPERDRPRGADRRAFREARGRECVGEFERWAAELGVARANPALPASAVPLPLAAT